MQNDYEALGLFRKLGYLTYRYRWPVLGFWAFVLIAGAFFAPQLGGRLKGGGFDGSGSEAERVQQIMVDDFGVSPATLTVVFEGNGLSAKSDEFQEQEKQALEDLRNMEEVGFVTTYADTKDPRFISEDGGKSYAVVGFNISIDETQDAVDEVRDRVRSEELTTYVTGAPAVYLDITNASNEDIRRAEKYAFPLALVILVIAFGTLVAAGIPVLIGGVSVLTALAALYFISGIYDMSVFVLSIATMLGLGLGIDYALFAVSRFREELESYSVSESVQNTVATAGRSIFFSGTAVLIGLSGLLFFPFMFMRSIGVAGVLVVFVSVFAALTLLPAVLSVLGHRVNALSVRRSRGAPGASFWGRSAEVVMRFPVIVILLVAVLLSGLLYPVAHMKIGIPEASVLPEKYESRAGDDILKQDFDYASLTPMDVIATLPKDPLGADGLTATRNLGERIAETEGVAGTQSVYTVGREAAAEYAKRVSEARSQAESEAEGRVDGLVEDQYEKLKEEQVQKVVDEQLASLGPAADAPGVEDQVRSQVEPEVEKALTEAGARGRIRDEVRAEAQKQIDEQVPELPAGISAGGEVTPQGVANFLKLPEAKDSAELQEALDSFVTGDKTLLQAETEANPYFETARQTVGSVRNVEPPEGGSFLVGGLSAGQKDFISSVYGKAPYAAAFVLIVTYLVLFLTFRSVFIPLKAVVVNILSLTASFGAMVFVFQDGNLSGLLNFTPLGFVDATLPILMFCTIFGVSMDYEVFLLSRIREAYENGDSNTASVAKGLVSTAGIITSAAAIIIVVTGAFAFTGIILTKAVGLGLAVAVFVDATIIRVMLVPATMRILGDWNWWPGGRKKTFGVKAEAFEKSKTSTDS
ncbi:MAG: MMPL family transporter [Rubrobacteraceae bacterium]